MNSDKSVKEEKDEARRQREMGKCGQIAKKTININTILM